MRDPLRNISVRYKLPLTFAGVCVLAFGVGGYLVSNSAMATLEREILARLEFQSGAYATALDGALRALGQRTRDFASDGYIRSRFEALEGEQESQRARQLAQDLRSHMVENKLPIVPAFLNLALVGPDGATFLADPDDGLWAAAVSEQVGAEGDFYSGLLPAATADGHPIFAIATPLFGLRSERRIGSLLVQVHPGVWLASAIATVQAQAHDPEDGLTLKVIDGSGARLAVPREWTEKSAPDPASGWVFGGFGLRVEDHEPRRERGYSPVRGEFSCRMPISINGWSVEIDLQSQAAVEAISGLQVRFVMVGLVLTLGACLLLIFPMRFLARPLIELREAARQIKEGDFTTRVAVDSQDELGDLGRSFNLMAEAVEERASRLQASAADLVQRKNELRWERDRLNAVISSMRDGLMVLDADGAPVVWNAAARPLVDVLKGGKVEPTGHHICSNGGADAGGNGDPHASSRCVECMFNPALPPRSCLIDIGTCVYEIRSTRLTADRDDRPGLVLVSRDVTDRVEQDEREIHQERLAVLGEVAAVVAHELNNPLAAITMFNQMLVTELPADSPLQENVSVIERNAQTCKRTIRELLDYSRGMTPEIGSVDVHATLEDAARFLRALRERGAIEVALELTAENAMVEGDDVQLRQVFVNLIMNAMQAAKAGGGRVTVRTSLDARHLIVDVADDGPGVSRDLEGEIFKPFFTTKPRGIGTGLGLPTARRIAEIQGGGLELVDSRPGHTTFQVRLLRSAS